MTTPIDLRNTGAGSRADYAKGASGAVVQVITGDTVPVKNSAGSVTATGTATVSAGAVSQVALASTVAIVASTSTATIDTTGITTATNSAVTFTVANGVITVIADT